MKRVSEWRPRFRCGAPIPRRKAAIFSIWRGVFISPTISRGLFRSVVPAHSSFTQKINTGTLSESDFNPQLLSR